MPPKVQRQISDFFANYRLQRFKKGETLIFAGEVPDGIYYMLEGGVRQYDISKRGIEMVVNIYRSPSLFPMSHVFNKIPNEYFFAATMPVAVRQVPVVEMREFITRHNDVAIELLRRAYQRLDGTFRRQTLLMGSGSSDRLIYEIVMHCHQYADRWADGGYVLRINETDLAAQAGLARETVSRRLQALKEKRILAIYPKILIVYDLSALESLIGGTTKLFL